MGGHVWTVGAARIVAQHGDVPQLCLPCVAHQHAPSSPPHDAALNRAGARRAQRGARRRRGHDPRPLPRLRPAGLAAPQPRPAAAGAGLAWAAGRLWRRAGRATRVGRVQRAHHHTAGAAGLRLRLLWARTDGASVQTDGAALVGQGSRPRVMSCANACASSANHQLLLDTASLIARLSDRLPPSFRTRC